MRVARKARSRAVFSRRVGGIVVRGVALGECVEVRMLMGAVAMAFWSPEQRRLVLVWVVNSCDCHGFEVCYYCALATARNRFG